MIRKLKKYLVATVMMAGFAAPMIAPVAVFAAPAPAAAGGTTSPSVPPATGDIRSGFCGGVDISVNADTGCSTIGDADTSVNSAVKLGINLFSSIVGLISVIMIIVGGIKYITSGGDSGNVTSAKNTIMYAVIGLVVVALAQIIVRFVLQRFTS